MIKILKLWILHYKDENLRNCKITFQQEVNTNTKEKKYKVIDNDNKIKEYSMEDGNKIYKEMINKFECVVNKIV